MGSPKRHAAFTSLVWLPQGLSGKESACNAGAKGDSGLIPGSRRSPGERHGNPWTLADYSPQGNQESDMTEATCAHMHYHSGSKYKQPNREAPMEEKRESN